MSTTQDTETAGPIRVGGRYASDDVQVRVGASHGPDWFPVQITAGLRLTTMLYLRRAELHALRCRLAEIDDTLPQPETKP